MPVVSSPHQFNHWRGSQRWKEDPNCVSKYEEGTILFYSTSLEPQDKYILNWTNKIDVKYWKVAQGKATKNNCCTEPSTCEVKKAGSHSLKTHNTQKINVCFVLDRCRMSKCGIKLLQERYELGNTERKFSCHVRETTELLKTNHKWQT